MLPAKLKAKIARDVPALGPRAVIEAMRNALMHRQEGAHEIHTRANTRCAAVLTEILKHWKEPVYEAQQDHQ